MSNIATVFVRIVKPRPIGGGPSHTRLLSALMHAYGGHTYCVPIWASYRERGTCFDLQFGAKSSPGTGPERLWRRLDGSAEAIWIRWFDSGADFDDIFSIDAVGTSPARRCLYRFDSLALHTERGEEQLAVKGTYVSGNSRGMNADGPPTPTTHAEATGEDTEGLDETVAARLRERRPELTRVDYFFRGRRVRAEIKGARGWSSYGLDDWDNCADPDFLAVAPTPVA